MSMGKYFLLVALQANSFLLINAGQFKQSAQHLSKAKEKQYAQQTKVEDRLSNVLSLQLLPSSKKCC